MAISWYIYKGHHFHKLIGCATTVHSPWGGNNNNNYAHLSKFRVVGNYFTGNGVNKVNAATDTAQRKRGITRLLSVNIQNQRYYYANA